MTVHQWFSKKTTGPAPRRTRPLGATLLLGFVLLGSSATVPDAQAQKGGKTPPPPPPPVLPDVLYTLQWLDGGPGWEVTSPKDLNNLGDVVGYAQERNYVFGDAFTPFACSRGGTPFDLNGLNAPWYDLNAPVPTVGGGWRATFAYGINDERVIVGYATNVNTNVERGFVLTGAFGPAPYFWLLPTVGTGNQYARHINNHGQIVGTAPGGAVRWRPLANWPYYQASLAIADPSVNGPIAVDINDAGDIVANGSEGSYRQTEAGAAVYFPSHIFARINDATPAQICGSRNKVSSRLAGGAFRLAATAQTGGEAQIIFPGAAGNYARAINDSSDTVVHADGRGFLYTDAVKPVVNLRYGTSGNGLIPLDSLVWNADDQWRNTPFLRLDGSNNRADPLNPDDAGFGQICGRAQGDGNERGFLLTPVPAP